MVLSNFSKRIKQTLKEGMESSASGHLEKTLKNFPVIYRSTLTPLQVLDCVSYFSTGRGVGRRFTLAKPSLACRVLSDQQGKMKHHHDAHAKSREMAGCNGVLPRDHQTSQKRQFGIVLERTAPCSYRVQIDDGQVWRRHADDVLMNSPNSNTTNQEAVQAETEGTVT